MPERLDPSAGRPAPAADPGPPIAVVIPCYNHGRFVADAVRSCLAGAEPDVRIVIVDDGSDDGSTPAACDACAALPGADGRVAVVHQANRGLPAARNRGASDPFVAGLPLVLFLDADDYLEPGGLAALAAAIRAEDDAGRGDEVSHAYGQQRQAELHNGLWKVPDWDPILLMVTNIHPPLALVRRRCWEAAGGFDESMRLGYEDWDFWLRMAERGWRGVRVQRPVYVWRRHSHDTMIHRAVARHDEIFAHILRAHADLYRRHAPEVIALSNSLLRRADANWLDESLEAIIVRDQRRWIDDLVRERDAARADADALRARAEQLQAALAAAQRPPPSRARRAVHRILDALPGPLAAPARGVLRAARRAISPRG
jgi:glycosyltransferase involved in cell wall biosynthesis